MWIRLGIVITCSIAALAAVTLGPDPFNDWSSQLLWLAVNVVLVTLAIEALLSADLQRQRRRNLTFGFQTRIGLLLEELVDLTARSSGNTPAAPLLAIGATPSHFAESVGPAAQYVTDATDLHVERYDDRYSTVWSLLDDLGRNYIRLFSRDEKAMLANFRELHRTARQWRYVTELTATFAEDLGRLEREAQKHPDDDSAKKNLDAVRKKFNTAQQEALDLLKETGRVLVGVLRQSKGPLIALAA